MLGKPNRQQFDHVTAWLISLLSCGFFNGNNDSDEFSAVTTVLFIIIKVSLVVLPQVVSPQSSRCVDFTRNTQPDVYRPN